MFAGAYGSADLAGTEALRPDHRFRIASVSKPVTGIAVLRAAEAGLVDLDAAAFGILADSLPAAGADPRRGTLRSAIG
jgi:CubicO group peptidase (beta-lactamase class C family)